MLLSLTIENIAIIEKAEITLSGGLNVLTGETGAGKSIIIDSLSASLGRRTSRELVRTGADRARVTAVFEGITGSAAETLGGLGIEVEDGTVIIDRVIFADGRNVCRANGAPVTVGTLRSAGEMLVNIHGQHDNQALLLPEKHCGFIDSVAENEALRAQYKAAFSKLVAAKRELDSLCDSEDEKAAKTEFLDYRINELETAALKVGEKEELTERKNLCMNAQRVKKSLSAALACLSPQSDDESGALDLLSACCDELGFAARFSKDAALAAEKAKTSFYAVSDLSAELRGLCDGFDFDESELAAINERLDVIFRMTSKYGPDEEAALKNLEEFKKERESIRLSDERINQLEAELVVLSDNLKSAAARLTESRKRAGELFQKRVCEELSFLDMPNVKFIVSIKEASYSSRGADNVEFLLSSNPGEEPRPLAKIASGGELSRIMLAIKNVISAGDDIGTLVFDEVDTGVSGRAAQKIGLKLSEVSRGRQVICVTHLAQIAAQANRHLCISKSVSDGKTFTEVKPLGFEERKAELARIMGGLSVTELQLKSAEEMLLSAGISPENI